VKDLRETIKALRAEIADEKKRLDRAESSRHKLEEQTHTLSAELKSMTDAAEQHQTLMEELRTTHTTLEHRTTEAEQGRATAEASATATIKGLETRLVEQQRIIDSLIDKIGE